MEVCTATKCRKIEIQFGDNPTKKPNRGKVGDNNIAGDIILSNEYLSETRRQTIEENNISHYLTPEIPIATHPEGPSQEERLLNNMRVNGDIDETTNGTSLARDEQEES